MNSTRGKHMMPGGHMMSDKAMKNTMARKAVAKKMDGKGGPGAPGAGESKLDYATRMRDVIRRSPGFPSKPNLKPYGDMMKKKQPVTPVKPNPYALPIRNKLQPKLDILKGKIDTMKKVPKNPLGATL